MTRQSVAAISSEFRQKIYNREARGKRARTVLCKVLSMSSLINVFNKVLHRSQRRHVTLLKGNVMLQLDQAGLVPLRSALLSRDGR